MTSFDIVIDCRIENICGANWLTCAPYILVGPGANFAYDPVIVFPLAGWLTTPNASIASVNNRFGDGLSGREE